MVSKASANGKKIEGNSRSFLDTVVNVDFFIQIFCFLSVLFIGADLLGVNVGVNFRLDQIFLVIFAFLLAVKNKLNLTFNLWIIAFAVFCLISTVLAFNVKRSILFYCSVIYNTVFIFYAFSSYVNTYGLFKFLKVFRYTCYVQFVIFLLQYVLKVGLGYEFPFLPTYGYVLNIPRFRLWFYEPSYLATYLIFWLTLSLYAYLICKDKSYLKDICICLIMLILCTASTGFLGIALAFVIVYIIWICKGITAKKLLFPIVVLFLALIAYIVFKDIFDFFVGRMFTSSLDSASGGRITTWKETYGVFAENPLFGVGLGCYGLYLGNGTAYVPSNLSLDLLSTTGIFGTIAFYGLTIQLCVDAIKSLRRNNCKETHLIVACALGLVIFTLLLQVNQGYLRLYHWMFFGVIEGALLKYKNNCKKKMGKWIR